MIQHGNFPCKKAILFQQESGSFISCCLIKEPIHEHPAAMPEMPSRIAGMMPGTLPLKEKSPDQGRKPAILLNNPVPVHNTENSIQDRLSRYYPHSFIPPCATGESVTTITTPVITTGFSWTDSYFQPVNPHGASVQYRDPG